MLNASILSFDKGDNTGFVRIFSQAVFPNDKEKNQDNNNLGILTSDDLTIDITAGYDYYEYEECEVYDSLYKEKILQMDVELELLHNLAEAEEDVRAGRVAPMKESFADIRAALEERRGNEEV